MRDSSRRFTFSSAVWLIVLVVPALLLLLCYLSMYVNPARFWPAGVLAVLEFPVAIINVLLLVAAFRFHCRQTDTVFRGRRYGRGCGGEHFENHNV